jgi:hypothetical protein
MKNDVQCKFLEDRWLNTRETSVYLGISEQNLRVKVCRGQLIPCYLGSRYRFKKSYLDSVVQKDLESVCRLKKK